MVNVSACFDELDKIRVELDIHTDEDADALVRMWQAARKDNDLIFLPIRNAEGTCGKVWIPANRVISILTQESTPRPLDVPSDSA